MQTKFNFNSAICTTKEQSERLLALGLKKETADFYYYAQQRWDGNDFENTGEMIMSPIFTLNDKDHYEYLVETFGDEVGENDTPYVLPAWSLHRLIEIMPKIIVKDLIQWYLSITPYYNDLVSYENCGDLEVNYLYKSGFNNLYDNIIDCIEWLIKKGYFNKEYLEE